MNDVWFQHPNLDVFFPSCIFDNVENFLYNCSRQDQMRSVGLSEEMQEGIMDERFKNVRGTLNFRVWVIGFVRENLRVLRGMGERIERNLEIPKNGEQGEEHQRRDILPGADVNDCGWGKDTSTPSTSDVTTLYRATTYSKLLDAYRSGDLQLETMSNSTWPADFSHEHAAYYLFPQRWVAERHAAYLRRNARIPGDIYIFTIHIPNEMLPQEKAWDLRMNMGP